MNVHLNILKSIHVLISYEEKCERLLHPRYCPDLATWPAWNQAFNSATGKK
jgi:hypothetical protein